MTGNRLRSVGAISCRLTKFSIALCLLTFMPIVFALTPQQSKSIEIYNQGRVAYRQDKPELAIKLFTRACQLNPNFAEAYYNLGIVYQSANESTHAVSCFRKVLLLNPNDLSAQCQLTLSLNTSRGFHYAAPRDIDDGVQRDYPTSRLANVSVEAVSTAFHAPAGLAFDRFGNLYVANFESNTIDRISKGGNRTQFNNGTDLNGPIGLTFDAAGCLYAANYKNGTIARIAPTGSTTIIALGFNKPYSLCLDDKGDLYVSQQGDNSVVKLTLKAPVFSSSSSKKMQGL
jgi:DNA-binding beta-propeller fold protein YncE